LGTCGAAAPLGGPRQEKGAGLGARLSIVRRFAQKWFLHCTRGAGADVAPAHFFLRARAVDKLPCMPGETRGMEPDLFTAVCEVCLLGSSIGRAVV